MKVNGATYHYEGQTVQEVLAALAFRMDRIVVEYNDWESTRVSAADTMEVVTFVGGG